MKMSKYSQKIFFCTLLLHLCFCVALDANTSTPKIDNRSVTLSEIQDFKDDDEYEETWLENALRDIAYYLRNHKFNEWDRRYYRTKPNEDYIGFYESFPSPSLKSIHWDVQKHCRKDFFKCITYLHKVIKTAPFARNDDLVTNLNKNSITINVTSLRKQNNDCKRALLYTERTGLPFGGPLEKFIWRTSASYYMCWYTMKEYPALSMLGESCDNFANCLDTRYGNRNHDPRSNDMISFACAMYSFCPDPCCSLKHVQSISECFVDGADPCYSESNVIKSQCGFDRKFNQNFEQMIENRWNVSCTCHQKGFRWDPKFGLCVDVNECHTNLHRCDRETEDCVNEQGSYQCVCKWGYVYDPVTRKCAAAPSENVDAFYDFRHSKFNFDFDLRDTFEPVMNNFF